MPSPFDPTALLAALGRAAGALAAAKADLRKPTLALLETLLKAKGVGLAELRAVHDAVGQAEFRLALDALGATAVKGAAKRLDPGAPEAAGAAAKIDAHWARRHLAALAAGEVEPEAPVRPLDKLLPARKRTVEALAALRADLGDARFLDAIAAMAKAAPKTMVKKLDPHHPKAAGKAAGIDEEWARARLAELAGLAAEGAEPPEEDGVAWFARLQKAYRSRRE